MSEKPLKKQLYASIAMTLVAAVALGSSTFAWFVTNNSVKATTSSISAQSNASFMTIKYNGSAVGTDKTSDTADDSDVSLYPATFGEQPGATVGEFMTRYGASTDDGTLRGSLKVIGNNGAPDEANDAQFAKKLVFNVSSRGKDLTNLRVDKVESKDADGNDTSTDSSINAALRLLVKCGDRWVVIDRDGTFKLGSDGIVSADGVLADKVNVDEDTEVDVYMFYEGSDKSVYTSNLEKLTASSRLTVTFTADSGNVEA